MTDEQIEKIIAANNILAAAISTERKDRAKTRKLSIACACISVISCIIFFTTIVVFSSGISVDKSESTTNETTVTQNASGSGDAVYQAGEGSQYYDGGNW